MNEKTIRCPKGPAIIFLITAITYLNTILMPTILSHITGNPQEMPQLALFRLAVYLVTALFMSIVLFSKKYSILPFATVVISIPSIVSLFFGITVYRIIDLLFFLLLIAFTCIMVKMPESPIREKATKLRFVIPVFQFILILISTIQTINSLYESLTEKMGPQLNDAMNYATVLVPSILSALFGFLPVLCYALLVNWLADPYKK